MAKSELKEAVISTLRIIAEHEKLITETHAMVLALKDSILQNDPSRQEQYERLFLREMSDAPTAYTAASVQGIYRLIEELKALKD